MALIGISFSRSMDRILVHVAKTLGRLPRMCMQVELRFCGFDFLAGGGCGGGGLGGGEAGFCPGSELFYFWPTESEDIFVHSVRARIFVFAARNQKPAFLVAYFRNVE